MKIFIRVESWVEMQGKVSVKYFTWDGICLCTKEYKQSVVNKPAIIDKKSLSLGILKEIYNK